MKDKKEKNPEDYYKAAQEWEKSSNPEDWVKAYKMYIYTICHLQGSEVFQKSQQRLKDLPYVYYTEAQTLEKSTVHKDWDIAYYKYKFLVEHFENPMYFQYEGLYFEKALLRLGQIHYRGELNVSQEIKKAIDCYALLIYLTRWRKGREEYEIFQQIIQSCAVQHSYELIETVHKVIAENQTQSLIEPLCMSIKDVEQLLYKYYVWAAENGEVKAYLQAGKWVDQFRYALKYYHKALALKQKGILYALGELYEYGREEWRYKDDKKLFVELTSEGLTWDEVIKYYNQPCVKVANAGLDWDEAVKYYYQAVESGDTAACYRLAEATRVGELGITSDYKRATDLYLFCLENTINNQAEKLCFEDVRLTLLQLLRLYQKGVCLSPQEMRDMINQLENVEVAYVGEAKWTSYLICCVLSLMLENVEVANDYFLLLSNDMPSNYRPRSSKKLSTMEMIISLSWPENKENFFSYPGKHHSFDLAVLKGERDISHLSEEKRRTHHNRVQRLLRYNIFFLFNIVYQHWENKIFRAETNFYWPRDTNLYTSSWYLELLEEKQPLPTVVSRSWWRRISMNFLDFLEMYKEFFELLKNHSFYNSKVYTDIEIEEDSFANEFGDYYTNKDLLLKEFVRFFYVAYKEWFSDKTSGDYQHTLNVTLKNHFLDLYSVLLSRRQQNPKNEDTQEQEKEWQSWRELALSFCWARGTANMLSSFGQFRTRASSFPHVIDINKEDSSLEEPSLNSEISSDKKLKSNN